MDYNFNFYDNSRLERVSLLNFKKIALFLLKYRAYFIVTGIVVFSGIIYLNTNKLSKTDRIFLDFSKKHEIKATPNSFVESVYLIDQKIPANLDKISIENVKTELTLYKAYNSLVKNRLVEALKLFSVVANSPEEKLRDKAEFYKGLIQIKLTEIDSAIATFNTIRSRNNEYYNESVAILQELYSIEKQN